MQCGRCTKTEICCWNNWSNNWMQFQTKLLKVNHMLKGHKMSKKILFNMFVPSYTAAVTLEVI